MCPPAAVDLDDRGWKPSGSSTGKPPVGWASRHLEQLRALDASATRVADKLPDNYLFLGLPGGAGFRGAKFVHCRRDLRDIAVSCWMTNFRHMHWATDPDHIARRGFNEFTRLMAHQAASALPVPLLEMDYEDTWWPT